jgi:hypothetical protein
MKAIDRKLLFHLVDIVWGEAFEDESVPSTEKARQMIKKAIERRRLEKYCKENSIDALYCRKSKKLKI